ncbi:ATPase family AAA domain-containing protein 2 [Bombina bombina]|uniref:ATPase family AAA domain-containing protein 2 n=1 Tax=Bombina bombina TaxID=8345 RepID=UPI00235A76DD|nr:ATPase family AAA domain-containing protein 2 [Bombina bombina]
MVLLRSATGAASSPYYRENESLLDTSSEFLSLESPEKKLGRTRKYPLSNGKKSPCDGPFSAKEDSDSGRILRSLGKRKPQNICNYSDSSMDKTNELNVTNTEGKRFTRGLAKLQTDAAANGDCNEDEQIDSSSQPIRRTRSAEKSAAHEENGDVEVRRSGRIRRSRYSTTNQSVLFDKLITNTAEAVLQKMDHMKKMRRRRLRELDDPSVFNDTEEENLDMYSRVKQKRNVPRLDEETTDNQEESGETSEEGEDQDEEDGEEDNQKRYELRQRKAVVPYQAPLTERRSHKKQDVFYTSAASPVRRRYHRFSSSGPRSPYCKRRLNRRRHAIHSSDSTSSSSSSSSSSDDEQHLERRRNRSRSKAISRCLPLNMQREDLKGFRKDRMKIGGSLADVDPMQIDTSMDQDSVTDHRCPFIFECQY